MAARQLPDVETLRKLLRYDPETGKLYWLPRPVDMFSKDWHCRKWNTRFAGKEALTAVDRDGYLFGTILYKMCKAHRVAWAIHHGFWPPVKIDHRNCDTSDNRISNLRLADNYQNAHNQPKRKSNKSGFKGVSWDAEKGRWLSRIFICGKAIHLGRFDTPEEAHKAYCRAAIGYCGEFARTE